MQRGCWSRAGANSGTRPAFKLVTGISTGALVAPFAFLGPNYDPQLRAVYTGIGPADVYEQRWLPKAIFNDSFADTTPLFLLISRYVDTNMLAAIANEYNKGRLLLIGTTSLDAQRPVIWNIGAIAASGRPGALELICKVILGSASIPGAFPPVMIDVEADGRRYQEMNVDGGVVAQTFLYPADIGMRVNLRQVELARERHAYIIRNSRLDPDWASVNRRFLTISGRAIATMIHYIGYSDILRIYATAKSDGVDYNLAYIETDFPNVKHENFDPAYMNALFNHGYAKGLHGFLAQGTADLRSTSGAAGERPVVFLLPVRARQASSAEEAKATLPASTCSAQCEIRDVPRRVDVLRLPCRRPVAGAVVEGAEK